MIGPTSQPFLLRLRTELIRRWRSLAGVLLASLMLNLCALAAPRITQAVLGRVIPQADTELLLWLLAALAVVGVLQVLLTLFRRLALVRLSLAIDRNTAAAICHRLWSLPLPYFQQRRAGDLAARVRDASQVRHVIAGNFPVAVLDAVMTVAYLAVMASYSMRLTLLVSALLVAAAGASHLLSPLRRKLLRRLLDDQAAQEARLVEAIAAVELVKTAAAEEAVHRDWEQSFERYLISNYRTQGLRQAVESAGAAVQLLSAAILLGFGAVLAVHGQLDAAQLVAFSMYAGLAVLPVTNLISLWDEAREVRAAADRVDEVLAQPAESGTEGTAANLAPPLIGAVRFDRVSFSYGGPDGPPVLTEVSFELRPGEAVALVGASGSGKSTIARLLLGLLQPTSGRILIDGVDLARLDLRSYRRQVGTALQENLLLAGTIGDNIALGDLTPDAKRIHAAGVLAGVEEFVDGLPARYYTPVGERGVTLSGGQRQRIALARVLYRDSRLVVLDEATSALDGLGAAELRRRLREALRGRSVLMIAHDPTVATEADRVLILREGRIVETEPVSGHLPSFAVATNQRAVGA
jgi:subfamily B ATP-binding cassette protein HlyB/CyaB